MVAEAYHVENDLGLAVRRLALLGDSPPGEIVAEAIEFGLRNDFVDADMALMQKLSLDLQTWNPSLEAPAP
jgi:hypothetical protein